MGISVLGRNSDSLYCRNTTIVNNVVNVVPGNPDPFKFSVIATTEIGEYLIAKIKYPDCKNYEGTKILVYRNVKAGQLRNFNHIDPHFSNNPNFQSPIARFIPTEDGWNMARRFCEMLKKD